MTASAGGHSTEDFGGLDCDDASPPADWGLSLARTRAVPSSLFALKWTSLPLDFTRSRRLARLDFVTMNASWEWVELTDGAESSCNVDASGGKSSSDGPGADCGVDGFGFVDSTNTDELTSVLSQSSQGDGAASSTGVLMEVEEVGGPGSASSNWADSGTVVGGG